MDSFSYLKDYMSVIHEDNFSIKGFVQSENELQTALDAFEQRSPVSFIQCKFWARKEESQENSANSRLLWADDILEGFLLPYMVESRQLMKCSHSGKPVIRNKGKRGQVQENGDHSSYTSCADTSTTHSSKSKKIGCEAKLVVRTLILYPDYKLKKDTTSRHQKENKLTNLKCMQHIAASTTCITIEFPKHAAHTNHVVGAEASESDVSHQTILKKAKKRGPTMDYDLIPTCTSAGKKRKVAEDIVDDNCSSDVDNTSVTDATTGGGCSRFFLSITRSDSVFQTEDWHCADSALFQPVKEDLLVNIQRIEQISSSDGLFFVADESGKYSSTLSGKVVHLWRYDDTKRKLYISRSFLFTSLQEYTPVQQFLQSL